LAGSNLSKHRDFAIDVVRRLREAGFVALWAGGCVRDLLVGRAPKDYDVATSANPDQIRGVFGHRRTLPIGAAFGVITVLGPPGAGQIDVATFRSDEAYSDGRRPDAVRFSSPEEDASRRDFTINGIFCDPIENKVIDYVGGQRDIAARIVRAIGDPRQRIDEDKLRMLRAVRFAATLDFELDEATHAAVAAMAPRITVVSAERIAAEFERMLTDRHRARAVALLRETGLLTAILPEATSLADDAHDELWQQTVQILEQLDSPTFGLAMAALLAGVLTSRRLSVDELSSQHHSRRPPNSPALRLVSTVAHRWKLSNTVGDRAGWLLDNSARLAGARRLPWSQLQPLLAHRFASDLVELSAATTSVTEGDTSEADFCRRKLALPREQLDPPPLITGDDLHARGVPAGPAYRRLLEAVRAAQLDNQIDSKAQALERIDRLLTDKNLTD
jgi:tRNA nucleotidyltransferase/poly(A) polymerase